MTGCSVSNEDKARKLSLTDLKYPVIDVGSNYMVFLHNNNDAIVKNHIWKVVSEPGLEPMDRYSSMAIEQYKDLCKETKMSFADVFKKWHGSDTTVYNRIGQITNYNKPNQFGTYYRYQCDTFGYLKTQKGGSCTPHDVDYSYYFSPKNRTLYYIYTQTDYRYAPLDYMNFVLQMNRDSYEKYEFDTAGYLKNISQIICGGGYIGENEVSNLFVYTPTHQIDSIIGHHTYHCDYDYVNYSAFQRTKTHMSYFSYEAVADYSFSKYHYTGQRLDSITHTDIYEFPHYIQTSTSYFDSNGLLTKYVQEGDENKFGNHLMLFSYIRYQ